jgi:hypothetical protein
VLEDAIRDCPSKVERQLQALGEFHYLTRSQLEAPRTNCRQGDPQFVLVLKSPVLQVGVAGRRRKRPKPRTGRSWSALRYERRKAGSRRTRNGFASAVPIAPTNGGTAIDGRRRSKGQPSRHRDIRAFSAIVAGRKVQYHQAGERTPAFTDRGNTVDIHDTHRRENALAALQLSAQKWGSMIEEWVPSNRAIALAPRGSCRRFTANAWHAARRRDPLSEPIGAGTRRPKIQHQGTGSFEPIPSASRSGCKLFGAMVRVGGRLALSWTMLIALGWGCAENHGCPVKDDRHQVVTLTDSPTTTVVSMCVETGDCMHLCSDTAMAHSSPDHSEVYSCKRVDADGGVDAGTGDAGANDGVGQVTLEIDYKVYPYCGV